MVHPEKEKAQLKRSWWREEEEARNRGWLKSRSEREWITDRWVVTIVECVDCGRKGKWEELNQGREHPPMEFFKDNWCWDCQENWEAGQWEVSRGNATQIQCSGCRKTDAVPGRLSMEQLHGMECGRCVERKRMVEVAQPREEKAQPKGETEGERDVRRTVKMITEVWMKVGIKRLDSHEGVTVKALLDSGATGLFADRKFVEKHGFKMQKLDRPVNIKNIDCSEPTPEPELSQLLFYQCGQRELIRVPISLVCLLIHISNGLCTYYPALPTK